MSHASNVCAGTQTCARMKYSRQLATVLLEMCAGPSSDPWVRQRAFKRLLISASSPWQPHVLSHC
eukprot:3685951-Rhodomonas_salina.2